MHNVKKIIGTFLIASIGGVAGVGIYKSMDGDQQGNRLSEKQQQKVNYHFAGLNENAGSVDFVASAEKTVPAVVHVKTTVTYQSQPNQFQWFFGTPFNQQPQSEQRMGTGSGVIISDDGYIATNNHVVADADKVEVTLDDKRTYVAKVVGTDPNTDLAVLKIEEKGLPWIPYGNSDNVKVGEWALAVGNPFNLTSTVTAGIISAKGRNIHIIDNTQFPLESFIQTDAAVNPGNSGGALVNIKGELIGINSAIASNTGTYTGYAFAVPVNIVKKVVDDLVEYGKVQRGFIGVSIRDIDADFAKEKNIRNLKGVYVAGLTPGGSAENAGIREGDVIKKVGEVDVNSSAELQEQVGRFRPGDKLNVTVDRDGEEKELAVLLKNKEGNTRLVKNESPSRMTILGSEFEAIGDKDKDQLGIDHGVRVAKLNNNGKLRAAGIREGFVITSIDKVPVKTTEEVMNALLNKKGGVLMEGIYPNGMRAYYGFGL